MKKSPIELAILLIVSIFVSTSVLISCISEHSTAKDKSTKEFQFSEYTIPQLNKVYLNGEYSVSEVVKSYISRIEEIDMKGHELNSVIRINPDALAIALELDQEISDGKLRGPLHGIPVLIKDNLDTHDKMPTTAGSRALAESYPLADSEVARRLRDAGAVILGKANLSEWANFRGELSSSGWSGVGGQVKNPYVLSRNPCGSSSGSGVAVSANLCMLAIGTETNGSIVCPSSSNGIVGIKPTVGLVSRTGVIPISYTQDTPGPMARTVSDAAICLGQIAGPDDLDQKTQECREKFHTDYTQFLNSEGLTNKRIGLFTQALRINYKVDTLMSHAIALLKENGVEIVEIDKIIDASVNSNSFQVMLFEYKQGLNDYFKSLGPDAAIKNLEELIEFNLQDSVELQFYNQRYLEMALEKDDLDSEEYKKTLSEMLQGAREKGIDRIMDLHKLDAIIAPTGSPAWKTDWVNGDHYHIGSSSPAAIAGYPNITVPMGFVDELPVGISFFGRAWSEPILIEIAYAYEQASMHRNEPEFLD